MSGSAILGPAVAGQWYPARAAELRSLVGTLLAPHEDGRPDGAGADAVIVPHAGFVYSGRVAGLGFRCAAPDARRVLLLGPSHYAAFDGACVPSASAYRTPLGEVPLDREALGRLEPSEFLRVDDRPFAPEHSLEAEIPFLQAWLAPGWRLVPVLIGGGSAPQANRRVAEALTPLVEERTLVVVSSDFTHYGPRFGYVPFTREVPEKIRALDLGAVEHIVAGDRSALRAYVERTGATICGRAAIDVLLALLGREAAGRLVAYDTSARITGDWSHSVSYASLALDRRG